MKVDRKSLLASLNVVEPALRSSSSMPALAFLWFREGYVYAYDGGMGMACALPAGVDLSGGVHGGTLMKLLGSSSKETIDIKMTDDNNLELKLGGPKAKLPVTPVDRFFWNFPSEPPDEDPLFEITEDTVKAIKAVMPIKHEKPSQAVHHAVIVESGKKHTFFYTTDSRSAARYTTEGATPMEGGAILLPRAFAQEMIRHGKPGMAVYGDKEVVSLFAGQSAGQVQVHSNALDPDDVPDIGKVVEKNEDACGYGVRIPDGFDDALDRAKILSGSDDPDVMVGIADSHLTVTGNWSAGSLDEQLSLTEAEEAAELQVKMNANLLKRGLAGSDFIAFADKCLTMYSEDDTFTYVVASVD